LCCATPSAHGHGRASLHPARGQTTKPRIADRRTLGTSVGRLYYFSSAQDATPRVRPDGLESPREPNVHWKGDDPGDVESVFLTVYCASDVPLRLDRPERGRRLARWVSRLESDDQLYVVGDLCDFWYGSRQRGADPMTCAGLRALAEFRARGGSL